MHPGAGHATGTLAQGSRVSPAAIPSARDRPSPRSRHVRSDGRLEDRGGVRGPAGARETARAEREYLALVRGRPRSRSGRIEAPIGRDRRDPTRRSLDTDSPKEAVTHFEVVELFPAHALLRVQLETGRTHQICVHVAAIGLPVAGDPVYGTPEPGLRRQFLHAARLAFDHPVTGARIDVESPLPPDLQAILATM